MKQKISEIIETKWKMKHDLIIILGLEPTSNILNLKVFSLFNLRLINKSKSSIWDLHNAHWILKIYWARAEKCQKMSKVHEPVPWFDIIIVFELLSHSTPTGAWLNAHFKLQKGSCMRWFSLFVSLSILFVIKNTFEIVLKTQIRFERIRRSFLRFLFFKIRTAACQSLSRAGMTWHRCPYNVNYFSFWPVDVKLRVNVRSYHNLIE